MVAGEASGDLLAGLLLDGMLAQWPRLHTFGIGGPQMALRGFDAWWSHEKLAVHGFSWELMRRYREIIGIRSSLKTRLLQSKPQVFIGVDAPDFNLDLEAELKNAGIKTVHFVCPSVWAWRPKRLEKIKRSVDHVLCIFPFEPALLARHGIHATYVGHPLASHIPMQPDRAMARAALGFSADDCVVALLPGSRRSEVQHLALRFFMAAALVLRAKPAIKFVIPVAPLLRIEIEKAAQACGMLEHVLLVDGQSHTVLAACDVTLIASGTATLEAALFKRPMVIAYHMSWLSWQIMRRKRLQPWVGLPNILCGEFVVPEYLQDAATPQALASAVLGWLQAEPATTKRLRALNQKFTAMHTELRRDTAQLAAHAIQQVLQS
ncbi:lipid-A-disaccharide synthase [Rhodoferax aquaticus]|uniref:Lipid-A-disaccharide synthase n=1 Tax=Rhodoferax aquaticus TaxID=2527691 RepID=A0A515EVN3_9BURK|nr:lipid-A-disaccharide synthase [Rhodoferax aquaticus]